MGAAATEPMSFPVLVGDIGGTNARFALIADRDQPPQVFPSVATADFPDLETAVASSVFAHSSMRPKSAIIDVAGPIKGEGVDLTNAHWVIRPRDTIGRIGIADMILLNDFEALALALTALESGDLVQIGSGEAAPSRPKVVVGPGTGLGVGALVEANGLWVPVPGEGGHVALGPAEADEFAVWPHIDMEFGRISAETLLCGRGLVRLYRAVTEGNGVRPDHTTPASITQAALTGSDSLAARTLSLYSRLLGRVAGDIALIFMATGGVYVGGGISPRILPFLSAGEFRRAFEAKAPHQALMSSIPTSVIVTENPALRGLAAFARSPEQFGVNLSGRRWQS
jgi:glucokinase